MYFYETLSGAPATAMGWGHLNDGEDKVVNNLNWENVTTISNDQCKAYYGNQITDNMLCVERTLTDRACVVKVIKNKVPNN